jgi:hydrogenase maturation protein HypF
MVQAASATRYRIRVEGIVQGVGFRPFVYALAHRCGLSGSVGNDAAGVLVEVQGPAAAVAEFQAALVREAPPLAVVDRVTASPLRPRAEAGFTIAASRAGGTRQTLVSPDVATCEDCLRELFDPADRRYRYPFVNCTNCGPRYTIITDLPYDRSATTMAGFVMCADCAREYADPADRRFHAQPVCCPGCGPSLRLVDRDGHPIEPDERPVRAANAHATRAPGAAAAGDPLRRTAQLLRAGRVVAVKGLGGYHLAADAASETAVAALRSRKHREDKPFAVLAPDLVAARNLAVIGDEEARLLQSPRRPIVLLRRHPYAPLASGVAPGNRYVGLMLPYTPVHHLLAAEFGRAFVLTSGNVSDEPIAYHDDEALARLADIADAFLVHDRPIHTRVDDSVVRVFAGAPLPVRRSRGYAPQPIRLPRPATIPVLGCGAELKSTFCLARDRHAFVSPHIGDLTHYETLRSYEEQIAHLGRLLQIEPQVVAYDLHPEYLSTKYAVDLPGVELVGVQHHHAHIAACLADNGETGPVIGVAFDGLGYGTDGTIWGGEFLVADLVESVRHGRFAPVPMPGGTTAIRQPWRMAAAYLTDAYPEGLPDGLAVAERNAARWRQVLAVAASGVNSPLTSSAGRLFDAVAALVGVRDKVNYEGQAAIELEQLAGPATPDGYRARFAEPPGEPFEIAGADLVRAAADDVLRKTPVRTVAGRFHRGMADAVAGGATRVREATGLATVALSGGVFQNVLLLELTVAELRRRGFAVLTHHQVPPNDGGISLGQAAVAAARRQR